jgi:hypothetical protein
MLVVAGTAMVLLSGAQLLPQIGPSFVLFFPVFEAV